MIREHWEAVEAGVVDRINGLVETALPQKRRLTEREQLQRYLSYTPQDFNEMRDWLTEKHGPEKADAEFNRYVTKMESYRSKYA